TLLEKDAPRLTEFAASIAAEAGGSPYFIDELVRSAGVMGQSLMRAGSDNRAISLSQMIMPRLRRLPPEAERLLQLVAVNGQPVPSHILKRAAGIEGHESALALLHTEHLIRTR